MGRILIGILIGIYLYRLYLNSGSSVSATVSAAQSQGTDTANSIKQNV